MDEWINNEWLYSAMERFFPPSCFFFFFAYLSHLKDSDQHVFILHKDNASKYKMQFLNDHLIY